MYTVYRLKGAKDERKVLGINSTLVPFCHHCECSVDNISIGLNRGQHQEGIPSINKRIDNPVVFDFKYFLEDWIVFCRYAYTIEELGVSDCRFDRLSRPATEYSLQQAVFDLYDSILVPFFFIIHYCHATPFDATTRYANPSMVVVRRAPLLSIIVSAGSECLFMVVCLLSLRAYLSPIVWI
ncbi:MAG: hypothetical protein OEV64_09610 [Desulfobulbaceae bacterium]|nr:hypothetical protein [Desulfobulbaceae bacterium]